MLASDPTDLKVLSLSQLKDASNTPKGLWGTQFAQVSPFDNVLRGARNSSTINMKHLFDGSCNSGVNMERRILFNSANRRGSISWIAHRVAAAAMEEGRW